MDSIVKGSETADTTVRLVAKENALGVGSLGIYAALGAVTGTVPLPWVPDSLARRVRGALAQDVVARRGLSLTPAARAIFAASDPSDATRGVFGHVVRYATGKLLARFTPLGFLPPLRVAAKTFALGYLLERYLETKRDDRAIRIDADEALRVRKAIDQAVVSVLKSDLRMSELPRVVSAEDLRDSTTQLVDGVIIAAAGVPDWVVRRLNAAFDECMRDV